MNIEKWYLLFNWLGDGDCRSTYNGKIWNEIKSVLVMLHNDMFPIMKFNFEGNCMQMKNGCEFFFCDKWVLILVFMLKTPNKSKYVDFQEKGY